MRTIRSGQPRPPGWRSAWAPFLLLAVAVVRPAAADEPQQYIVGPQDVLAITVYDQPHLSGRFAVEADGTFTFPLLGRVKVGGLSLRAVEEEVEGRLAQGYLKNPQVTVAVDQYRSQQIFVMGEVRSPGPVPLTGAMTLIEALARAGSTTERAGPEAVIVRALNGDPASDPAGADPEPDSEVIRVNLQRLQSGALSQNVSLRAGDTIFVPRAETVFVFGQVRSPGEYVVRKAMTVMQVLSLAGGITDRGSSRRIQIIREVDGTETTIAVGLQDPVQSGDTVLVRERFF